MDNSKSAPRLLSIGELSKVLRVEPHRIRYILSSRNIRPAAVAGQSFVYDDRALARVRSELQRIAAEKGGE